MKLASPLVFGTAVAFSALVLAVACSSDPSPATSARDAGPPDAAADPTTDDDAALLTPVQRGGVLAKTLGCHTCHDSTAGIMAGNNDGISGNAGAERTTIYPANLTPDPETGLGTADGGWTDPQIARAIKTGVDDECRTLCSAMPRFSSLNDDDVAALIAYLRSLTPVRNDVTNQGCPDVDAAASGEGHLVDAGDCR